MKIAIENAYIVSVSPVQSKTGKAQSKIVLISPGIKSFIEIYTDDTPNLKTGKVYPILTFETNYINISKRGYLIFRANKITTEENGNPIL